MGYDDADILDSVIGLQSFERRCSYGKFAQVSPALDAVSGRIG